MTTNPLDFSNITRIEVPVVGPDKKKYLLKEADGNAACVYRNAMLSCTKLGGGEDGNKLTSVEGMADVEPLLVSLCLFNDEPDDPAYGKAVHISLVKGWPNRVQKALYDEAREISGLGGDDEDEETKEEREGNS